MADNKVNFLRGTSAEYESSTKDNDTFYYTTDDEKLYLGNKEITGGGVTVDDTLSDTSKNPVQNKVINAALNSKADLSDIPTTLPANGGNAQALTDYNSTDVRLMLGWRGASLDSTSYLAGYDTSELESNGIVKIKDINADKAYVGNAGNADTVDGKHAESFMQWLGDISDVNFLNNANYKVDYHCNIGDGSIIGLPIAGWYHIVYYMHLNLNGYGMQIAYPLNFDGATMIRRAVDTTWGDWKNVADGGNAMSANHQIQPRLPDGTDVLTYATSDNCPYNVNTKVRIMNSPTCPTNYGYNAADNDFWYDIYKLDSNSWVTIKAYDVRGNVEFINSCINSTWSGWVRCNDGGNATTANFATYSDYAGGSVQSTASNVCLRNISAGTEDLTAGSSPLANGSIYLVYE